MFWQVVLYAVCFVLSRPLPPTASPPPKMQLHAPTSSSSHSALVPFISTSCRVRGFRLRYLGPTKCHLVVGVRFNVDGYTSRSSPVLFVIFAGNPALETHNVSVGAMFLSALLCAFYCYPLPLLPADTRSSTELLNMLPSRGKK